MNVTQQGIIILIKSAITGQKLELPEGFVFDSEESKAIIKRHHLMQLIYVGAVNCGISSELSMMKNLFSVYCKNLVRSEQQMAEVQRVFQAFDQHGIDYLPTKGCNMKSLYPKPEMRLMGDADISIRREQCELIGSVMTSLGFTKGVENENVVVWSNVHLTLELHKKMLSFYNKDYYEDVWSIAKYIDGHRYVFSAEDAFIHIFNHFTKHFRGGGIGCRHVVDLYVYRRVYPEMDEEYICREFEKLQLLKFYHNMCHLLDVWFGDRAGESMDDVMEHITQYIFNSGSWGTLASHTIAKQVTHANEVGKVSNSRLRVIMTALLPPNKMMVNLYPFLDKAPYLLPVTWVIRAVRILLFRGQNISKQTRMWRAIEDEKVCEYQRRFRLVGLDVEE